MKPKLSMLLASSLVLASASAASAPLWKQGMTVAGVQSTPDGGFIIYGPYGADTACAEGGRLFYVRPNQNGQTAAGIKSSMAVVLTAFTTGKTVTFQYDNGTPDCFVSTVLVNP